MTPDLKTKVFRGVLTSIRTFCHVGYAQIYLGWVGFFPFSMAHYLIFGERRGWLPNPFFDPRFFETRSGTPSFLSYFCKPSLWSYATSERFQPNWYRTHADVGRETNPLADFWTRGFMRGTPPAPGFDMPFFRNAVCRDRPFPRLYTFEIYARGLWTPPKNADELLACQTRFKTAIDFRVLFRSAEAPRKDLVFIQAGSNFDATYLGQPRSFDVLLNYYEAPGHTAPADHIVVQNGTKTTAISEVLTRDPDLFLRYRAVMFLDDDVEITGMQIESLFDTFEVEGLDLAQASLTKDSACFCTALKQPKAGHRLQRLNGVEIMMPILSRRVIERFGWVFAEGISGWGIDSLLGVKVREAFGTTIALIGDVAARHVRPMDTDHGRFYRFLRQHGIDANTEAGDISLRHGLTKLDERLSILDGRTVGPHPARRLTSR